MGHDHASEPDPRPARLPGDPPRRCLWCYRWRCDAPLSLCPECEASYAAASEGMPPDDPGANPMGRRPRTVKLLGRRRR